MEFLPGAQFEAQDHTQLAPTRHRDDGWTAERQRAFLEVLAACGSVAQAARSVGMSRESAYALRRRADARAFVQAWDAARALAVEHLTEVAWDRALHGQLRPVYYHGEQVGEIRHFDNRLLLALIAQNRAAAGAALPSAELVAEVAQDWGAALERVENGEPLAEPAAAPAGDPATNEAAELELGRYGHWWDAAREEWLTNWPAPTGFDGEELAIDARHTVTGPYDPAAEPTDEWDRPVRLGYARTLSAAERTGLEQAEARAEDHTARRIDAYRRAAFGLASAAELARLSAANPGQAVFSGRSDSGAFCEPWTLSTS